MSRSVVEKGRPRVSIGLPVYNGENYLRQGLESLLGQTYTDFELIIADNASTDSTEEICRGYAGDDPRIRYFRHESNRGASYNFNYVVHQARGRYFKWHAHDDACLPEYLERCVGVLDEAPETTVLCQCRSVLINDHGEHYAHYGQETRDIAADRPHDRLRQLVEELRLCTYVFGLIRTEALRGTRMIDSFVSADVVLLVELALRGKFVMAQDFLQLRRVHPESSRLKNTSPRDLREWFDPNSRFRLPLHPRMRYGLECLRSIWRAPLSVGERARCYATFVRSATRRRMRAEGGTREQAERNAAEGSGQGSERARPEGTVPAGASGRNH